MCAEVTVAVRVKPGASRARVGGSHPGPYGPALVVAVSAPAVDGRATEAARRAVADALGLRPGAVALRRGATSRDKLFSIDLSGIDLRAAGRPGGGTAAAEVLDDRLRVLRDGEPR